MTFIKTFTRRKSFSEFVKEAACPLLTREVIVIDTLAGLPDDELTALLTNADQVLADFVEYEAALLAPYRDARVEAIAKVEAFFKEMRIPVTEGVRVKRRTKAYNLVMEAALKNHSFPTSTSEFSLRIFVRANPEWMRFYTQPYVNFKAGEYNERKVGATIRRMITQSRAAQAAVVNQQRLRLMSVALLLERGSHTIDQISKWNDDQIVAAAREIAAEEWLATHHPSGTEIDLDDNICECESYTMGERRCSCGNRRISAYAEGDLATGFYLAAEPY